MVLAFSDPASVQILVAFSVSYIFSVPLAVLRVSLLEYMYLKLTSFCSVQEDVLICPVGSAEDLDKCVWGESYWCSDLPAAKTCGAFKHCMTTVWKNQKLVKVSWKMLCFSLVVLSQKLEQLQAESVQSTRPQVKPSQSKLVSEASLTPVLILTLPLP